ncbi:translation initiation factor IF-2-like isoform X3 [Motacilla alba alba]|uniref:translation initiation factor IF-2-like isoform X3 n=1 Tax=Motacilla alba alba TaxID=1094192 RepID=UPI0018D545F0|nr:translation initiation factor IF-2-like isoform X3 [Motacilla alba alba]
MDIPYPRIPSSMDIPYPGGSGSPLPWIFHTPGSPLPWIFHVLGVQDSQELLFHGYSVPWGCRDPPFRAPPVPLGRSLRVFAPTPLADPRFPEEFGSPGDRAAALPGLCALPFPARAESAPGAGWEEEGKLPGEGRELRRARGELRQGSSAGIAPAGYRGSRGSRAGCSTRRAAGEASPGSPPRGGTDRGRIPPLAPRTPGTGHPGTGHRGSSSPGDGSAGGARPAPEPSLGTARGRKRRTGGGHPPTVPSHPRGVTETPCRELRMTLESAGTGIHHLTPGPSTPRRSSPRPGPPPTLQGIQGLSISTARPGATARPGGHGATSASCSWCPGRGVPDPPEGTSRAPSPPLPPPPRGASRRPGRSRSLPGTLLLPRVLQRGRSSRRMCQWGLGGSRSPPVRPGALWRAQLLMLVLQSCRWSWKLGRPLWAARIRIPVLQQQLQPLQRRPPGILRSRSTLR